MTVTNTECEKRFHGSGSTGPFTWTWRFLDNDDILVYLIAAPNVDETLEVRTLLGVGDYTLSGAGSYTGGAVTLAVALAVGTDLLVIRKTAATQAVSIRNQGNSFRPEVHETVFDRLTMMAQDRDREIESQFDQTELLKTRMLTAETDINAAEARLDGNDVTLTAHTAELLDHETRLSTAEGTVSAHGVTIGTHTTEIEDHENRVVFIEATIAGVVAGIGAAIYVEDATLGQTYVDIPAANDPVAREVIVIKTKNDVSINPVTIRPTSGTVEGLDGPVATFDLIVSGGAVRLIPIPSENHYYQIGFSISWLDVIKEKLIQMERGGMRSSAIETTLAEEDHTLFVSAGAAVHIAAYGSLNAYKEFIVKNVGVVDSTLNAIDGKTIDGVLSANLIPGEIIRIKKDGANWQSI